MLRTERALWQARQVFYRADGPWRRRGVFEALGSQRFSRPALFDMEAKLEPFLPSGSGVFVEAGAHDGYTQSNTYWLERHRGWSGVLVEAVPELAAKCARRRPRSSVHNCALVADAAPGQTVTVHFGDLMSAVAGARGSSEADVEHAGRGAETAGQPSYQVEVPARTLTSVLADSGVDHVDLLCLDIEGLELEVLRGLDFDRFGPKLMLVEMLELERQLPDFESLLGERYGVVGKPSDYDVLFGQR